MKFITTVLLTLFLFQLNAQIWDKTLTDSIGIRCVAPTSDGGSVIIGNRIGSLKLAVLKVDVLGKTEWSKNYTDITMPSEPYPSNKIRVIQDSDGNYWIGISQYYNSQESVISKLDKNGNRLSMRVIKFKSAEINVLNNQLILFGVNTENSTVRFMRFNANGDTLVNAIIPNIYFSRSPFYVSTMKSNELLLYGMNDSIFRPHTVRIGLDGLVKSINVLPINTAPFITPYPYSQIIKASDGSYYIPDSSNIVKVDSIGGFIWRKPIAVTNPSIYATYYFSYIMAATKDGGYIAIKNNTATGNYLDIQKFSPDGVKTASSFGFYDNTFTFPWLMKTAKGGYLIAGNLVGGKLRLMKLDESGYFYPNFIKGNIFSDRDDNCRFSGGDIGIQRVLVVAKKTGTPDILALSDSVGRYNLNVDVGTYAISIINPNSYMTPCTPSVTKTLSAINSVDSADFPLKSAFFCGLMQVDIATPRLRRCFNNTYTVSYCNKGTALATDAYVNVTLDSL